MTTLLIRSPLGSIEARRLGFLRYQARSLALGLEWYGISLRTWRIALKLVRTCPEGGWTLERVG